MKELNYCTEKNKRFFFLETSFFFNIINLPPIQNSSLFATLLVKSIIFFCLKKFIGIMDLSPLFSEFVLLNFNVSLWSSDLVFTCTLHFLLTERVLFLEVEVLSMFK